MLTPGLLFSSGRVDITAGAGQTPDFISGGFGFMNDGSLAIDTDAAAGTLYVKGIRVNAATGAAYGTTSSNASDLHIEGIRISADGAIVYESAAVDHFASGNPVTANGRFAVT